MARQVCDRLAEPGIRLRRALGKLRLQPTVQFSHRRTATFLMKSQPSVRQAFLIGCWQGRDELDENRPG